MSDTADLNTDVIGSPGTRPKKRVVVADDSHLVRAIVVQALKSEFDVVEAGHGGEVLDALKAGPVDLIFLDLIMPTMDGRETINQLRKAGEMMPIIVMTGEVRTSVISQVLAEGVSDYILKPVSPGEIVGKARKVLGLEVDRGSKPKADILLVDAVPNVGIALKRNLPRDITLVQANDFSSAFEACREHQFRVIIVDMNMSEIGGEGLGSQLRILQPGTAVFGLYLRDVNTGKAEVLQAGFDGHLYKPFEGAKLKDLIKYYLGREVEEPLVVEGNFMRLNDFPVPKAQRQTYAMRLRQDSTEAIKVIAGACFETTVLDITHPPPREIMLGFLNYLRKACANIGVELVVVADSESEGLIKTTSETADLLVFETSTDAENYIQDREADYSDD